MQIQMTERDKKLIVFLAVFVIIVAGGYWGLYPIVSKISSIENKIEDAEATKSENEIKTMQLPMLEDENEELESDIETCRSYFYSYMTSDQVDKYVTGLILDHKLYAYDLSIEMPKEEAYIEPYIYSEKAAILEASETQETNEVDINSDEDISVGVYMVSLTMRVGGEATDLQRFLDDLFAEGYRLRVKSYEWANERSVSYNEDGTYNIDTNQTMTISIELFMSADATTDTEE